MKNALGTTIKGLREAKGMSHNDLAEQLGVSDKDIYKWEKGLDKPSKDQLAKMAMVFEVSPDEFNKSKLTPAGIKDLIDTIFKGVSLAMGVAVLILHSINKLDTKTSIIMLSIGLACLTVAVLNNTKE